MKIEAFISKFSVEALDKTVFDGPAWSNEDKLDLVSICPLVQCSARKFRAVIDDYPLRQAPEQSYPVEYPRNS